MKPLRWIGWKLRLTIWSLGWLLIKIDAKLAKDDASTFECNLDMLHEVTGIDFDIRPHWTKEGADVKFDRWTTYKRR